MCNSFYINNKEVTSVGELRSLGINISRVYRLDYLKDIPVDQTESYIYALRDEECLCQIDPLCVAQQLDKAVYLDTTDYSYVFFAKESFW